MRQISDGIITDSFDTLNNSLSDTQVNESNIININYYYVYDN